MNGKHFWRTVPEVSPRSFIFYLPTDIVVRSIVLGWYNCMMTSGSLPRKILRTPKALLILNEVPTAPFIFGLPSDHGSLNLHSNL